MYVGLDGQDLRAAGGRKGASAPDKVMGVVPGIFRAAGFGAELEPGRAAIGAGPAAGTWLRRYGEDRLDIDRAKAQRSVAAAKPAPSPRTLIRSPVELAMSDPRFVRLRRFRVAMT